ncbi:hypothetical protein [Paracoccus sp. (in: a-proteobacteria)]|uniref:hypothetical protein n=1 Tax=Paracoccus sp. TaxID=267 RepID=UPI0026E03E7C|nr:hypothetical protein [Paracoccus sp. (in: a-proteobacteria)]MDO5647352.1 hypothetical protein [Paracoccus sp. (in: a-proteobacteria)]
MNLNENTTNDADLQLRHLALTLALREMEFCEGYYPLIQNAADIYDFMTKGRTPRGPIVDGAVVDITDYRK